MKKIYFLVLLNIVFTTAFSQNCISLGCAANYGTQTSDGTLPNSAGAILKGCYTTATYKQVFWQFFYSPTGGNFTQAYTPVAADGLDLDYIAYDIGLTGGAITCPVDPTPWTLLICNNAATFNAPTGPGVTGGGGNVFTTVAGHYYAIAVVQWQGTSTGGNASYSFTVGTPQLGAVDLTPANCPGLLPVVLSSFNARANNCAVNLDWVSQSQTALKSYEVQYSTDGSRFQTIATVAGIPGSANQEYSYQHYMPLQGNNYYRLKMLDLNGKFEYSKVISFSLSN